MDIIISNASEKPIYDQIYSQVKSAIMKGVLKEGDALPSIREIEAALSKAYELSRACGVSKAELAEMLRVVAEEV